MHLSIKFLTSRERGDTLVEVLIAIAVVSLVLGGAYVTTNRSLLATRAAQERGIALKLAESQIERLKGIAGSSDAATLFGVTSPFCISTAGTVVPTSNADCALGTAGTPTTTEPVFHISIVKSGADNTFTLTQTWASVSGRNLESLQLSYRVYE